MMINAGNYQIQLPPIASLLVLLVFIGLLSLGFWQMDRAEEKQSLLDLSTQGEQLSRLVLNERIAADKAFRYREVEVTGRYLPGREFLLDNQIVDRVPGYHVLSPFQPEGADWLVLINRGWLPQGADRSVLPQLQLPEGVVSLSGVLNTLPVPGIRLGDPAGVGELWPRVLPYADAQALSALLGMSVSPQLILLDTDASHGYRRQWQIGGFKPEKHYGYAVQWFGLALTLAVLYLLLNSRRRKS